MKLTIKILIKKFIKLNNKDNFQNLKIDKVSFKYGNNYVFKNINFEINKFDKIGISGNSGIGNNFFTVFNYWFL